MKIHTIGISADDRRIRLTLRDRLEELGFSDRRDARTYHDYRHTIYHSTTYDIVGRMDFQETLNFVREHEEESRAVLGR